VHTASASLACCATGPTPEEMLRSW
jgi:hypothetical protein